MKITQDVRDYAATLNEKQHQGLSAEGALTPSSIQQGMEEMSEKFRQMGEQVYVEAEKVKEKESNKAF